MYGSPRELLGRVCTDALGHVSRSSTFNPRSIQELSFAFEGCEAMSVAADGHECNENTFSGSNDIFKGTGWTLLTGWSFPSSTNN
jgi:hypothetical protein